MLVGDLERDDTETSSRFAPKLQSDSGDYSGGGRGRGVSVVDGLTRRPVLLLSGGDDLWKQDGHSSAGGNVRLPTEPQTGTHVHILTSNSEQPSITSA